MTLALTADATGTAIATALNALPKGEDQSEAAWKLVCEKLASWIATNAKATVPPLAIATTGTATAQSGPANPVLLAIT